MFWRMISRRNCPSGRVFSAAVCARAFRPGSRSRGNRASAGLSAASHHWREDWRSCAVCPLGASAFSSGISRPLSSNNFFGLVAAQPVFRAASNGPDFRARRPAAPGGNARSLPPCGRPLPLGQSIPSGSAARSWANAAGSALPFARASLLNPANLQDAVFQRRRHLLVHRARDRRLQRNAASSRSL